MFEWECPHCHRKFYSSNPSRREETVKCCYCGKEIENPFYEPEQE